MANLPKTDELIGSTVTQQQFKTKLKQLVENIDRSYSTLAEANADIANISVGVKVEVLNTVDGGLYEKKIVGATSLTKSPYDPRELAVAEAVEKDKEVISYTNKRVAQFTKVSENLFDKNDYVASTLSKNGTTLTPNATIWTSGFIPVEVGKKYARTNISFSYRVTAFDANKQPVVVDGSNVYWASNFESITIPSGVAYVRLMFANTSLNTARFIEYGKGFTNKPHLLINPENTEGLIKTSDAMQATENLFDKSNTAQGWYQSNGMSYIDHAAYRASDFIAVEAGKRYKRTNGTNAFNVYAYDSNKQPVIVNGTDVFWTTTFESTDIPSGVAYIRVLVPPTRLDTFMLTLSTVDTSLYIPYRKFKSELIPLQKTMLAKNMGEVGYIGALDYQLFDADYSHVIFYGQSLSMGWESTEALTTAEMSGVYMLGSQIQINQGNTAVSTLTPLIATTSANLGEHPAAAASHVLKQMLNKHRIETDLIVTGCGEGGKTIEQLSKESTNGTNLYNAFFIDALDRAKTIANNASKTIVCPAIVFMQGEFNYTSLTGAGLTPGSNATNDRGTYKNYLKILKDNMQADIMAKYGQTQKPLFFISQVGGQYINIDAMPINQAQIEFADENDDVVLLNPNYGVPDYNAGHLSSNGYRWYGELIGKQLYQTFFNQRSGMVVRAKEFEISENRQEIMVHCQVPFAPLVFDTNLVASATSYGFRIGDSTGTVNIQSVEIVGGTSILLKLAKPLAATGVSISYASSGRGGTGNLRDSEHWTSMYRYTDETAYAKKPTYTPKLPDGVTPIYGDKYPCHNWLVAFYKQLS